jgi:1-deoxy-D-xylulose-5-phosphate synthase
LRYVLLNGIVFSELGFQYFGPVDGHDLGNLIEMLEQVKALKGPVLLHVVTQKGRGYQPAAENATVYHGIAPFDLETGKTNQSTDKPAQTYTEAFSEALTALAGEDPRIVAITAAMADGTGLERFHRLYPERFIDVGIAEQTAVSLGTAMALSGFRPVVAVYSSFMQRAFDQLIQDAALQRAPVVFALDRSGIVGEDGPTHHGVFDLSYLSQIPNMSVLLPRDEFMLSHMLRQACAYGEGPVALRYPRGKGKGCDAIENTDPLLAGPPLWGKGQTLRAGGQVLIVAGGHLAYDALEAARMLEGEGIDAAVYDPCFLKPLDASGIWEAAGAGRCGIVAIAEENVAPGGLGWAVTQLLSQTGYRGRIRCLCVPDAFVPQGSQSALRRQLGLDAVGIAAAVREEWDALDEQGCKTGGRGEREGRPAAYVAGACL